MADEPTIAETDEADEPTADEPPSWSTSWPTNWADEDGDTTRVRGVGEPVGLLPARRRGVDDEPPSRRAPCRRCSPAPPPPLPPGTSLVVVDDDELDLHDLGGPGADPTGVRSGE